MSFIWWNRVETKRVPACVRAPLHVYGILVPARKKRPVSADGQTVPCSSGQARAHIPYIDQYHTSNWLLL